MPLQRIEPVLVNNRSVDIAVPIYLNPMGIYRRTNSRSDGRIDISWIKHYQLDKWIIAVCLWTSLLGRHRSKINKSIQIPRYH